LHFSPPEMSRLPQDRLLAQEARETTRGFLRLAHPQPEAVSGAAPARASWVLESVSGNGQLRQMPIVPLPFRIGRLPGLELVLPSHRVSKRHAEIFEQAGGLRIRDLQSRNGTYVNHHPVAEAEIGEGDVLHLGDFEFRIGRRGDAPEREDGSNTAAFSPLLFSRQFPAGTRELRELLRDGRVTVELQPIVRLPAGNPVAYEALGRGLHPALPRSPVELLVIAEAIGAEVELAQLFRRRAVESVRDRHEITALFLNTHPAELTHPGLLESIEALRAMAPHLDLVLEMHESALARPAVVAALRDQLSEINVRFAYDDFGSGQARLLELAEAPPHYLKFDRRFVAGIDQGPPSRRRLLASLVAAARELCVHTVAEGVETPGEAEACLRLGFTHAQGFHFGAATALDSH
jgi:EAL domain-containing protein (putative c-di-GMP-specific phosphodiesterase class I)